MKRKLSMMLVLLVVLSMVLAACGAEPTTAPPAEPTKAPEAEPTKAPEAEPTEAAAPEAPAAKTLKIGTLVSLEFPLGVDMQKELDALVPVLNEQGGITVGGEQYDIEIILYDTKLNPETGRAGAERLVFEDEVDFILGDETTDAWLSVTEAEKVLVVAMTPSPAVLDPQYNYVFQAGSINSSAGAMWGWLADNHPELKSVVAMFPDDGKGQAEAGMLQQIADAYGFELLDVLFYEPGTSDFSTYATRLATLDPDIYTTAAGGPVQDALSMRAMREAGWDGQIFLKTTLSPQKMSEIIDLSLVEGTIAGMTGTTVADPPPIAQELIDAYTAAYGTWDSPEVLHVLDFYVLKAAIEAADSLDVDDVAAALLGGLAFDSPASPGIMASRPDLGNDRAIDTVYETTIGQIVNGEAVVIDEVPIDKVIEYNDKLRGLEGAKPEAPPAAAYECPVEGGVYTFNFALPADRIGVPKNVIHYNHVYAGFSIEGLVQASNEEAGVYLPRLATSWELAPDKSSYTFNLREGVKFHDGSDFNAEVAKWNLDNFLAAGTPLMGNVTDVEVIDDHTIKLNLSSWDAILMDDIARASGMISKEAFEANGEEWANFNPIGTGPWVLKEFERQQKLVYEAFEDYWAEGLPCMDGLVIEQVPDPMTAIAMIKAGDVGALYQTDPLTANELMSTEEGYKIDIFPGLHHTIVMNTIDPESVWSDIRMREALEYAIDKQAIADATGFGFSKPYYEIIHSIHEAGGNPGTTPRTYDPDKARALIAEAGYADGLDTTLTFSSRQPPDSFTAMQQYLGEVGINVELNPMDDVALNQMSFEPPEGNSLRIEGQRGGLLNPLGSTKETLTSSSVYFPGLKRPEGFDDLIQQALDAEDPAEQMKLLEQAEKLAYEDVMFVKLWNMPILSVDDGTVQDVIWAYGGTPSPRFDWANVP